MRSQMTTGGVSILLAAGLAVGLSGCTVMCYQNKCLPPRILCSGCPSPCLTTNSCQPNGTGNELADIIPVPQADPPASPESFCKRKGSKLFIKVMNQGTAAAGPSVSTVEFEDLGKFPQPTPPLPSGSATELQFTIPQGCFGPLSDELCDFTITVDEQAVVVESNESNNTATGQCFHAN